MTGLVYLAALLAGLGCLVLLDRRFRLVLWADARRGLLVVGAGTAFFLLWDLVAIGRGFYRRGGSDAMTGVLLAPELPVEEPVFIVFLCYLTLVLHGLARRALAVDGGGGGLGAGRAGVDGPDGGRHRPGARRAGARGAAGARRGAGGGRR
ncbi:lycopene cyclase domain-containing protein [Georgenia sp. TF02-10]|uniref:lycopene cyclase domain-containing protein n=1 Tax=Georgenia sp. TF02-10 TaxID=2917725 RepID=UPI00352F30CE